MIDPQLFREIESAEFAFDVGVISGQRQFERAVTRTDAAKRLFGELVEVSAQEELLTHVQDLLEREYDPRYRHPKDIPLAMYLLALDAVQPALGSIAGVTALRIPNLSRSRPIAARIMSGARLASRDTAVAGNEGIAVEVPGILVTVSAGYATEAPITPVPTGRVRMMEWNVGQPPREEEVSWEVLPDPAEWGAPSLENTEAAVAEAA